MAKTALIIEDDETNGKLLSELCTKLGVTPTVIKNGKEGFEKAKATSPDLLFLDMLVPGMDGFKIAEGLRAAGNKSALIVVTGVYKDPKVQKEFQDKYGADFFLKPFKVDDVSQSIARKLGLTTGPAPEAARRPSVEVPVVRVGAMEGSLKNKPFVPLLLELYRAKTSGTLELTQGQVKKRIFMNRGFVKFAQSNVKAENVGGMQVAEGKLTEDKFQTAVNRARAEGISVGEALALSGVMSRDDLNKAYRRQVEEVVITAYAWQDATFKYAPGDTEKIQEARYNPVALVFMALKRFVTPEQAKAQLTGMAKATVARGPDFDRELYTMRGVFQNETVTPMINGRVTVGEIVAKAKAPELPLLLGAIQCGLAAATGAGAGAAQGMAAAAAKNPDRAFTAEEMAARESILAEYDRVMNADTLYAVLRLQPSATLEEIKAAYLPLAKRFHLDVFSGLELGDAEPKVRDLFGKISEANSTLSDPKKKADYDVLLERKAQGLPTDMEVIFKAEGAFSRGDALFKQGRFGDAEAAFREALKLDGSVAQYHSALAQALLKSRGAGGAAEAKAAADKAVQLNPEFVHARVVKAMAMGMLNDDKEAMKLLREILASNPADTEASRELRALKDKAAGSSDKGLLGKLFKK